MKQATEIVLEDLETIAQDLASEAPKLEGKTVLITGGAGFLGSYLVSTLLHLNKTRLSRPARIISLDNFITGLKKPLLNLKGYRTYQTLEQDVSRPLRIRRKLDYIIHAAGLASPYYYNKFPLETIESSFMGAKNLLELARVNRVKGLLFFSSSEVYGNPEPKFVPTKETYFGNVSSVGPRACYDESKRLAETLCVIYHQKHQVPAKIIRLFNVYGPGMKHTDYRVVPNFMYKGLKGEDLPVHDKGIQTRTFCYISDAVKGIFRAMLLGQSGEVYNLGNDKPEISIYKLAVMISKILDNNVKPLKIDYPDGYPAGEPQRRCPDITKIKTELSYTPQVSLKTGLRRTLQWLRDTHGL